MTSKFNHPWVSLPARNGGGDPGDGSGTPPPPPSTPPAPTFPPPIPMPGLAFLIAKCPNLTDANTVASLRRAMTSSSMIGPGADVRMVCSPEALTGGGSVDVLRVGAWESQPASSNEADGRDSLLKGLTMLRPGPFALTDTFGFFMNGSLIQKAAANAYASLASVNFRLASDGTPDSSGPINLTGMSVSLIPPNGLVTVITGYTTQTWPATHFTLTATDTLSIVNLAVSSSTTTSMTKDTVDLVAGILTAIWAYSWLASIFFFYEAAVAGGASPPAGLGKFSLGTAIAKNLPISAPAGPAKFLFEYRQVQVDPGGVLARGTFNLVLREPAVVIVGPPHMTVKEGTDTVRGIYAAQQVDVLPDVNGSFNPKWSASGGAVVGDPSAMSTAVSFDVSGKSAGDKVSSTLTVQLTDATAPNPISASATVMIDVVADVGPKPWTGPPLPVGAKTP